MEEILLNKVENINLNTYEKSKNFRKTQITLDNTNFEICVSIYYNVIFIVVTSNGKLGSFYMGECEHRDDFQSEDNIYEIKCLLGNRQDELNEQFCNMVIKFIFNYIFNENNIERFSKIEKIILSTTIKFNELFTEKKQFMQLIKIVTNSILDILNI
jgi:hypothetical protein